jgi:hypothetical protein
MADIFDDLDSILLPETALLALKPAAATIPVRMPKKTEFFQSSNDPKHRPTRPVLLFLDDTDGKYYLVPPTNPDVYGTMEPVGKLAFIFVNINRSEELFLAAVGTTDNSWHVSARQIHEEARTKWVRMASAKARGEYISTSSSYTDNPAFPDVGMGDLLRRAFNGAVIDDIDHPLCKKIRGVP